MANARAGAGRDVHPLRMAAIVVSAAFLLVGVAGFIPGLTTDYSGMKFAGHESTAMLLGLFQVSVLHNIVHLLFGIVGLAMARTVSGAGAFLVGGGVVYLLLWVYGLIVDFSSSANFVPLDTADNWLHLILGVAMVGIGLGLRRSLTAADSRTAT